jgi:phage-related protein
MPWTVVFYADVRGRERVREWLERLEKTRPAEAGRVRHHIDLLQEFGVFLDEPYSKQLDGKLRELRPGSWRITYFGDEARRMILLTSFRKTGRVTDRREVERAKRAMADWTRRVEKRT